MDNFETNEYELQRFTIRYSSSKLTAEQVGVVITQAAVMYRIIQDYLDSPHDLQLVKVVRGSYIFEFLGDPIVLEHVHRVTHFMYKQTTDLWEYIGDAITWDLIKFAPAYALKRVSDLSQKEVDEYTHAVKEHKRIGIESNSVVEYDFKHKKIIEYRGEIAKEYIEFKKQQGNDFANYYNVEYGDVLPPRSTKHKRKK